MMFKGLGVLPQRACRAFVWTQTLLAQLFLLIETLRMNMYIEIIRIPFAHKK